MKLLAALLTIPVPGLGHLLQRRLSRGAALFLVTYGAWGLGWMLFGVLQTELALLPAFLIHVWCVWDVLHHRPPT